MAAEHTPNLRPPRIRGQKHWLSSPPLAPSLHMPAQVQPLIADITLQ